MMFSITGIGWVTSTSMGCGRDHKNLITENNEMPKLTSRTLFGKTSIHFGRFDDYSKLGFAAITFALKDAQLDQWHNKKRPIGIIASTTYGCLSTDIDYYETVLPEGGVFASPNLFAYTLPNVFLGEAATRFGLTGPTFVVNEQVLTGMAGLRMALSCIASGEHRVVIAGLNDAGRPAIFDYPLWVEPGAVFFVIERTPERKNLSYGILDMDAAGGIFFRGAQVENLQGLKLQCIPL